MMRLEGLSIFTRIDSVSGPRQNWRVKRSAERFAAEMVKNNMQMMIQNRIDFEFYVKYERPVINKLSNGPIYTHSHAAPIAIQILEDYNRLQTLLDRIVHPAIRTKV